VGEQTIPQPETLVKTHRKERLILLDAPQKTGLNSKPGGTLSLRRPGTISLRYSQHCDGVSLVPLLKGGRDLPREAIFWHYPHYGNQGGTPGSSVRMGDYKLIEFFEDGRIELYDLESDPGEDHNLALEQPERAREMQATLQQWRESVEAKIPQPNPDWKGEE